MSIKRDALSIDDHALRFKIDALSMKRHALSMETDAQGMICHALNMKRDAPGMESHALSFKVDAQDMKRQARSMSREAPVILGNYTVSEPGAVATGSCDPSKVRLIPSLPLRVLELSPGGKRVKPPHSKIRWSLSLKFSARSRRSLRLRGGFCIDVHRRGAEAAEISQRRN